MLHSPPCVLWWTGLVFSIRIIFIWLPIEDIAMEYSRILSKFNLALQSLPFISSNSTGIWCDIFVSLVSLIHSIQEVKYSWSRVFLKRQMIFLVVLIILPREFNSSLSMALYYHNLFFLVNLIILYKQLNSSLSIVIIRHNLYYLTTPCGHVSSQTLLLPLYFFIYGNLDFPLSWSRH